MVTTIDIWDTVLRRVCFPDEVKMGAAGYVTLRYHNDLLPSYRNVRLLFDRRHASEVEIGNRRVMEGYDDEYELDEVWDLTLKIVAPECEPGRRAAIVRDVCDYEYALEEAVSYPDPSIAKFMSNLADPQDLWFLSDFYMKTGQLEKLVRGKQTGLRFNGGMTSVSAGVNKRSGRLFRAFADQFGGNESRVHVGDNPISDVSIPQGQGIRAVLYHNQSEERRRAQLRYQFERRMAGDYTDYWLEIAGSARRLRRSELFDAGKAFNIGVGLAPIYVLYTMFCIEEAIRKGVDRVYYFTREGEILARIHDLIVSSLPHLVLPKAQMLEVSRIATFGASVRDLSIAELNRIWTMYPNQSLRTLMISIGVDPSAIADHLIKFRLTLDDVLQHPWTDDRFLTLIEDTAFRQTVLAELAKRRTLLLEYLAQNGIDATTQQVVIADIGWRGTIQDNLARLLPDVQWHGLYLALFKFLNPQPNNVSKSAYLFDCNEGRDSEDDLTPQAPVEMLFNSDSGSVVGYRREADRVVAIKLATPDEDGVYTTFTRYVQSGVLAATPDVARSISYRGLLSTDLRHLVRKALKRTLRRPPPLMARRYFQLSHNETFGNGTFVQQKGNIDWLAIMRQGTAHRMVHEAKRQAAVSGWRDGFWAANGFQGVQKAIQFVDRVGATIYIGRKLVEKSRRHDFEPIAADLRAQLNKIRDPGPTAPSGKDIQPLLSILGDVDLSDPALLGFNRENAGKRVPDKRRLVMSWIIPDIAVGSGGHMTILRFIRYFQELGFQCRLYVHERTQHGSADDLRHFIEKHYLSIPDVEVYSNINTVTECDILISTLWITAYDIYKRRNAKFKAYFIQDFEPYFYPSGSESVFAENTYRLNLYGITASPWLKQVVETRYGMDACAFHLGCDPAIYYPDPTVERDPNRIAVYMRPTTERRGTELLIGALAVLKARRPKTKIVIFGTNTLGYRDIPFRAEVIGFQTEEQLRRQHSSAAISLQCSLTNYSLLPIEAAACGAVVVDLAVESMRTTFGTGSPIVLAPADPLGLATRLIDLLDNTEEIDRRSKEGIAYARSYTWESAFQSVANELARAYFGNLEPLDGSYDHALIRAEGGQRIYRVEGGRRYQVASIDQITGTGWRIEEIQTVSISELLQLPDMGPYPET